MVSAEAGVEFFRKSRDAIAARLGPRASLEPAVRMLSRFLVLWDAFRLRYPEVALYARLML